MSANCGAGAESRVVTCEKFRVDGDFDTEVFNVPNGTVLPAGSVVGVIDGTRNLALANAGAGDGSQVPVGITSCDVDTTVLGADDAIQVYVEGSFNPNVLNYDASFATVLALQEAFRVAGNGEIKLKTPRWSGEG